jgi:hypothetical protein
MFYLFFIDSRYIINCSKVNCYFIRYFVVFPFNKQDSVFRTFELSYILYNLKKKIRFIILFRTFRTHTLSYILYTNFNKKIRFIILFRTFRTFVHII